MIATIAVLLLIIAILVVQIILLAIRYEDKLMRAVYDGYIYIDDKKYSLEPMDEKVAKAPDFH